MDNFDRTVANRLIAEHKQVSDNIENIFNNCEIIAAGNTVKIEHRFGYSRFLTCSEHFARQIADEKIYQLPEGAIEITKDPLGKDKSSASDELLKKNFLAFARRLWKKADMGDSEMGTSLAEGFWFPAVHLRNGEKV